MEIHGKFKDLPEIHPLGCFMSDSLFGVTAQICVKKNDEFVSRMIVEEGGWEKDNVILAMKAMSLYDDAIFIGKLLKKMLGPI